MWISSIDHTHTDADDEKNDDQDAEQKDHEFSSSSSGAFGRVKYIVWTESVINPWNLLAGGFWPGALNLVAH
jgi:hypothetical protein